MGMILFSGYGSSCRGLRVGHGSWVAAGLVFGLVLPGTAFLIGLQAGAASAPAPRVAQRVDPPVPVPTTPMLTEAEVEQRVQDELRPVLDQVGPKVARLQAQAARLDAIAERLINQSGLDPEEFKLGSGGPETADAHRYSALELDTALTRVADDFLQQQIHFESLHTLLTERQLRIDTIPAGWPVNKGWISSRYGSRSDPVTGKKSFHRGVDFAVKRGTPIVAVASGIVNFSGRRAGYGRVVEIGHADGYTTVYAHNAANKVKVGEVVTKGQTIALVGSSGRSTGPHVHFEVLRNGRVVNPRKLLAAKR